MDIHALATEAGFRESFLLPVAPYTDWTRHRNDGVFHPHTAPLVDDPTAAYPWANAVLICVLPYLPYTDRHRSTRRSPTDNVFPDRPSAAQCSDETRHRCDGVSSPYRV